MKPRTDEQQAFVDQVATGEHVKGVAYAGCGKTHTLVITAEESLRGRRVGNFCFNRSTKDEANTRFPKNVKNYTWHSYSVPMAKQMNFFEGRKTGPMGVVIGLEDRRELSPLLDVVSDRRKAAFAAMQTITKFCQSDARRPLPEHVPPALLSRVKVERERAAAANIASETAGALWDAICARGSRLPMVFDHYLKSWALTDPELPFDTILLDECQDSNAVTLSVMMAQDAQQVYTGDSWQQIYAWRGAVDAMQIAPGEEVRLTNSFRFGPEIADRANEVLELLGEEVPLIGSGPMGTVVDDLGSNGALGNRGTILCRGNAGVVNEALEGLDTGKRVAVVGGTDEAVRLLEAAYQLYTKRKPNHPEIGIFDNWIQFMEFAESDDGGAYKPIARMVEDHGDRTPRLCDRLKHDVERDERRANLIVSTAHKAKGREWDDVRFAGDFPALAERPIDKSGQLGDPVLHREECNLAYVSVTRAMKRLNLGGYGQTIRNAVALMGGTPRENNEPELITMPLRSKDPAMALTSAEHDFMGLEPDPEPSRYEEAMALVDQALGVIKEQGSNGSSRWVATSEALAHLEEGRKALARAHALDANSGL